MKLLFFAVFAVSLCAFAEGSAEGHQEIPWKAIFFQALNFGIVVAGLFILLRKKVSSHFADRKANYESALNQAQKMKEEARARFEEMKERLEHLEKTSASSIEDAAKEAETMKVGLIQEASSLAQQIALDTKKTIELEVLKAKLKLREEIVQGGIQMARGTLKTSVDESAQKNLQKEFLDKIQVQHDS